jgi:ribosomal-protein-alanine N-acetyltransferase
MHIFKIAVKDNWRRLGIASRLLDNSLKDVSKKKVDNALLEVRVSNIPAISFYSKRGFISVGRRPNYYSYSNTKEDALLMMKNLKEEK